jgi:hypothetical protein
MFFTIIPKAVKNCNNRTLPYHRLFNEWYSEDLSENIRAVFRNKMKDGQFLGPFAPYGYAKSPSDRHKLVIDEEAAGVVRGIFTLCVQGRSAARIAGILTEKGIPAPSAYKKEKGLSYENPNSGGYTRWSVNTVRRILGNKTYLGQLIQGRERKVSYKSKKVVITPEEEWVVVKNSHEPMIDEKTFDMAQRLICRKPKH